MEIHDEGRAPGDLVQLKLRFPEHTRARLAGAAASFGNSLNSEIVARLDQTLRDDEDMGGEFTRRLMLIVGNAVRSAERASGRDWHDDPATCYAASLLARDAIAALLPGPSLETIQPLRERLAALEASMEPIREELLTWGALVRSGGLGAAMNFDTIEVAEAINHAPPKIADKLESYRKFRFKYSELRDRITAAWQPHFAARRAGEVLYEIARGPHGSSDDGS